MTDETTSVAEQNAPVNSDAASPVASDQAPTTPASVNTALTAEVAASTDDGAGALAKSTEPAADLPPAPDELTLLNSLKQVVDPELFVNIVDLGLVYSIQEADHKVAVDMTLTSPACPAGPQLIAQAKQTLEALPGIKEATIKLVMSPPWTPDRMTDEARDQLGIF